MPIDQQLRDWAKPVQGWILRADKDEVKRLRTPLLPTTRHLGQDMRASVQLVTAK